MATEGLMRMVESSRGKQWHSSKDTAPFQSPLIDMPAEESGFILKGHSFRRERAEGMPNRSGSAPPSMEGSFSAIENLLKKQDSCMETSWSNLSNMGDNVASEEQLRSDPAYLAYCLSYMKLNARPPLPPQECRNVDRHIGGTHRRLNSLDDSGSGSLHLSRGSLSTHTDEPGDGSSARKSDDVAKNSDAEKHVANTASLASYNKSLVDLIQQDFPRTPSPVYNQPHSSNLGATDEPVDSDAQSVSPNGSSLSKSILTESTSNSINQCSETSGPVPNDIPFETTSSSAQSPDATGNLQKDESTIEHSGEGINTSVRGHLRLDLSRMRGSNVDINGKNREEKDSDDMYVLKHQLPAQQGVPYQVQGVPSHLVSQGMNYLRSGMEVFPHGYPHFSSSEIQPALHSPGYTPSIYATTAAYMTSGNAFYPNYQPSAVFTSQYGVGGYPLGSTFLPSYMAGFAPHGSFPMQFDATVGPSFSGPTADASRGERVPHGGDTQHPSRFYGQHGSMLQPSFVDPSNMQQYLHPFDDVYGAFHYGHLASRGISGGHLSQQEINITAYSSDQKFHLPTNGNLGIACPRKMGINASGFYGNPSSMGVIPQFPASPLGSPLLPSSPVGRTNQRSRSNELMSPQGSASGVYPGWKGQRSFSFGDAKRHSFLEELKSSNSHKLELSDIAGRVVEFSVDQHGSRFIQQKLEFCSSEDKVSVFKEILPHASRLMTDVFGNYVVQKFFEYGSPEQKKELADKLSGQILPLSLQMYGCRVIQKALEVIELDQKTELVHELDGHVMKCVRDQNGNHVIQKCIECIPMEKIGFIISAFRGQVATLSTHPYGCRVIQRVLEHCSDELQIKCIVDEILESTYALAQDQYGNYVTQHVLERGNAYERSQVISKLIGKIVKLSQHKYASNVVEKCLEHGDIAERELLVDEIIGQMEENNSLLPMMKDQFANYVVQKVLETSNDRQRKVLLNLISTHIDALKKYTYGKHIVVRFQQLTSEESQASESEGA